MKDLLLKFWVWYGQKIMNFELIDIYCPNPENEDADVVAITFSHSAAYIDKIESIEL